MVPPPTYQEATAERDVWELIVPWVTSHEKTVLCRVSRHFHGLFAPSLWNEPTKLLLSGSYPVSRFDNFIRKAPDVRPEVRNLVVTFDFRALDLFNARNSRPGSENRDCYFHIHRWMFWLFRLERDFPLVSFVVYEGLSSSSPPATPFIDRRARERAFAATFGPENDAAVDSNSTSNVDSGIFLVRMGRASQTGDRTPPEWNEGPVRSRPLLLSAANCSQIISDRILINESYENLLFLDISGAKSHFGAFILPNEMDTQILPHLKVLKAKSLKMKDEEAGKLLRIFGRQLFSLDLRDNMLTDKTGNAIHLYLPPSLPKQPQSRNTEDQFFEDTPAYAKIEVEAVSGEKSWERWARQDDVDSVMQMIKEDVSQISTQTGLTHLYLSGNRFSALCMAAFLRVSNRLQVVDFGSNEQKIPLALLESMSPSLRSPNTRFISQLMTANYLTPRVSRRLQVLRVHHSIVTCTPTLESLGEFYMSDSRAAKLTEDEFGRKYQDACGEAGFLPDTNPRLQELILTDLPRKSSGFVIEKLKTFLQEASIQEARIASQTPSESRRAPRILPGLRMLRFEFAAPTTKPRSPSGPSVTGDSDADNFLAESMNDFSFFDNIEESPRPLIVATESLLVVRDELRAYRQSTLRAFQFEQKRLGVPASQVRPGPPHYHWGGQLELVG